MVPKVFEPLKFDRMQLWDFFQGTQVRVGSNRGNRVISVRPIEVLLYVHCNGDHGAILGESSLRFNSTNRSTSIQITKNLTVS